MPRNRHPGKRKKETLLEMWKRLNPNTDLIEYDNLIASIKKGECLAVRSGNLTVVPFTDVLTHPNNYQGYYLFRV